MQFIYRFQLHPTRHQVITYKRSYFCPEQAPLQILVSTTNQNVYHFLQENDAIMQCEFFQATLL